MLYLNTFLRNNLHFSHQKLLVNRIKMSARSCSSTKPKKSKAELEIVEDPFKPIYKFPYINLFSSINRLKIYQSVFTIISIPITYLLEANNIVPGSTTIVFTAIGITGVITLSLFSLFTTNVVGILYYDKEGDKLRISFLDFVGQRKNVIYDRQDIVPFSELPKKFNRFYSSVQIYDSQQKPYKLFHQLGGIMDMEAFSKVFGED